MHDYSSLKANDNSFSQNNKSFEKNLVSDNYHIYIYPNPANNIVNIEIPDIKNQETVEIKALDIIGKVATQTDKEYSNNVYRLNFSNISQGVYFVHIIIGGKVIIKKITIVK